MHCEEEKLPPFSCFLLTLNFFVKVNHEPQTFLNTMADEFDGVDIFANVASAEEIAAAQRQESTDGLPEASPLPSNSSSSTNLAALNTSSSSSSSSSTSSRPISPKKGSREEKKLAKQMAKDEEKKLRKAKKGRKARIKQIQNEVRK